MATQAIEGVELVDDGDRRAAKFALWLVGDVRDRNELGRTYIFLSNGLLYDAHGSRIEIPEMKMDTFKAALRKLDVGYELQKDPSGPKNSDYLWKIKVNSVNKEKLNIVLK